MDLYYNFQLIVIYAQLTQSRVSPWYFLLREWKFASILRLNGAYVSNICAGFILFHSYTSTSAWEQQKPCFRVYLVRLQVRRILIKARKKYAACRSVRVEFDSSNGPAGSSNLKGYPTSSSSWYFLFHCPCQRKDRDIHCTKLEYSGIGNTCLLYWWPKMPASQVLCPSRTQTLVLCGCWAS